MQPPRLERFGPVRLVGLMRQQNPVLDAAGSARGFQLQWTECRRYWQEPLPPCLGIHEVMEDGETHLRYFSGVISEGPVPAGLIEYALGPLHCAVFLFDGHISGLRNFVQAAFFRGLPEAGLTLLPRAAKAPELIERYRESFDPATHSGGIEILIPVQDVAKEP